MRLKETNPNNLTNRNERASARLARIARGDTYFGGASALVIAKRANKKLFPAEEIVADVYHGRESKWMAYECPECGQAHLGEESAIGCCAFAEEWAEVNEE